MAKVTQLLVLLYGLLKMLTLTHLQAQTPDTGKVDEPVKSDLEINVTVIAGTTGMGFAQIMDENAKGTAPFKYNFDIVSDASLASGAIINGTADMAAVPTNLAAVLYNKTNGGIQVVAVNTLGVLYLLSSGPEIASPEDLAGKTIYCCNQGANPEYISKYLIEAHGFEVGKDVMLDFTYNTPDELATAIATGIVEFAILPEPKVTAVMTQNQNVKIVLSLEDVWSQVSGGTSLVQGCLVARKEFIEAHKAELEAFLSDYAESIDFVNADPAAASEIIAANGIIPKAPLAQKAVITSTDGLCVPMMRCIPAALAFCASRQIDSSTSSGAVIIRSASSSIIMTILGIYS